MATYKTPVSMVQELMARRGITPEYRLIMDGVGSHLPFFKYIIVAGEYQASGSGRSKKEAKHNAAQKLLELLNSESGASTEPLVDVEKELRIDEELLEKLVLEPSSFETKVAYNPIGALQELCMTNELPLPDYQLVKDEGPPHAREFTMKVQVSQMVEHGVARTKKQAKHLAAQALLDRLGKTVGNVLETPSPMLADDNPRSADEKPLTRSNYMEVMTRYQQVGLPFVTTKPAPLGQKIADYHKLYRQYDCPMLQDLRAQLEKPDGPPWDDSLKLLEAVVDKLGLHITHSTIPVKESCTGVIAVVKVDTSPGLAKMALEKNLEEAKQSAALAMLKSLCLLSRIPTEPETMLDF